MIDACHKSRVKLMYAEELCFAPKYARLKKLLDSGALGKPTLVKQSEKHELRGRESRLDEGLVVHDLRSKGEHKNTNKRSGDFMFFHPIEWTLFGFILRFGLA